MPDLEYPPHGGQKYRLYREERAECQKHGAGNRLGSAIYTRRASGNTTIGSIYMLPAACDTGWMTIYMRHAADNTLHAAIVSGLVPVNTTHGEGDIAHGADCKREYSDNSEFFCIYNRSGSSNIEFVDTCLRPGSDEYHPAQAVTPCFSMSESSAPSPIAAAPDATALLDARKVLAAVADPARFAILRELAAGTPLSVNDLAGRTGRAPDLMSKHLRVLREARLIIAVEPPGADGRRQFHEIPAPFRTRDAAGRTVLDFGAVVLRM